MDYRTHSLWRSLVGWATRIGVVGAVLVGNSPCLGDVIVASAITDASIFEELINNSNGLGVYIHAGANGGAQSRRALIKFDLSAIPAGSTITAVTLTLRVDDDDTATNESGPGNTGPSATIEVRKLTQDWSEGSSIPSSGGGHGTAAGVGDVTWHHRTFSSQTWGTDGGSFSGTVSASTAVTNVIGNKTWTSAAMITDVQGWLNSPATNFGWILKGSAATESTASSARRFASRNASTASQRPKLSITFTPPVSTGACCATAGTCQLVLQVNCTGGQVYQGNGTSCSPNPCPQPMGACCDDDTSCAVTNSSQCANDLGLYRGDGTTCIPNLCPNIAGACCFPNSTCQSLSTLNCLAQSGIYHGYNTTCAASNCPWVLAPFVEELPIPPIAVPISGNAGGSAEYAIDIREFGHSFHPSLPTTTVWGYDQQYPGPTIEARRDQPVTVRWTNDLRVHNNIFQPLRSTHLLAIDQCLHGPDVTGRTPVTVVHLHGAHLSPDSDGLPDLAFRPGQSSPEYTYPNNQQAATLWYHDHALGLTRLNVYMGLAGFYMIRDDAEDALNLPSGRYEVPLVIQDRSFTPAGQLKYNTTFTDHFFGDFIVVNGKVWPYMNVDQGFYRFRMVNGSNTRTYTLSLGVGAAPIPMIQIGSDLGLLEEPVSVNSITIMPGERVDFVIDFRNFPIGSRPMILRNSAVSPFPGGGDGPDITNVMQFRSTGQPGDADPLPNALVPVARTPEADATVARTFQLTKTFENVCSHDVWLINSLMWDDITDFPVLGSTEIWSWVNRSGISHPMHIHLVQFQVLDRQSFLVDMGGNIVPTGAVILPAASELGWKDTVQATPNQITRVIARFDDYPGTFPFHCHILDHEDHEMMRQFTVVCAPIVFTTNPSSITVRRGQSVSLTAVATGSAPLGYQWLRIDPEVTFVNGPTANGSVVTGATATTFTIADIQLADAGRHACRVTDVCGNTNISGSAIITVLCAGDFNLSGTVSVQDIFDFLAAYFANSPSADVNNSGMVSVQDIFDFLVLYFGPC